MFTQVKEPLLCLVECKYWPPKNWCTSVHQAAPSCKSRGKRCIVPPLNEHDDNKDVSTLFYSKDRLRSVFLFDSTSWKTWKTANSTFKAKSYLWKQSGSLWNTDWFLKVLPLNTGKNTKGIKVKTCCFLCSAPPPPPRAVCQNHISCYCQVGPGSGVMH